MNGMLAVKIGRIASVVAAGLSVVAAAFAGIGNEYLIEKAVDERIEKRENKTEE